MTSISLSQVMLQQVEQYFTSPQVQVTSVSEFVDVQPSDWAFQALQSLAERYGCIVKPPAHQGRQATTRFEFAAGLNACLNQINKQMAASVENLVTRDDLLVIQRLQEEFAAELSVIRGRVDAIEARTALLEQQQFSTVTQLRVGLILSPYGVADSRVARNRIENELLRGRRNLAETTIRSVVASSSPKARIADKLAFGYRVSLNFDTSFTGQDRLRLRLRAGDVANLAGATGTNEARLSFDAATEGRFLVDYLSYDFTFDRNRGRAMIAGGNTEFYDYFPTYNPLASDAAGSVSRFGRFNPLFYRAGNNSGSGAFIGYQFNPTWRVDAGYLARHPPGAAPAAANPQLGLFGSNYTVGVLLGVEPTRDFKFGIGYTHTYNENFNTSGPGRVAAAGINLTGGTGTGFAVNPFCPLGTPAVCGAGKERQAVNMDTINWMFQWRALPQFTLAGWFGYGWARGKRDGVPEPREGTRRANLLTAALVFAFPDVVKRRGDLAGLIVGIPPYVVNSDWLGAANHLPATNPARQLRLQDRNVPVHLEALYRFQVNKYLTITPGAFVVFHPNGDSRNDPIVVYTIRTTFTF